MAGGREEVVIRVAFVVVVVLFLQLPKKHPKGSSLLPHLNLQTGCTFWYRLTHVVQWRNKPSAAPAGAQNGKGTK